MLLQPEAKAASTAATATNLREPIWKGPGPHHFSSLSGTVVSVTSKKFVEWICKDDADTRLGDIAVNSSLVCVLPKDLQLPSTIPGEFVERVRSPAMLLIEFS